MKKQDDFIRKQIAFNKNSAWHMEILNRINSESKNFSGYVMGVLKSHLDSKPELKEIILEKKKEEVLPEENTQEANKNNMEIQQVATSPKIYTK